MGIAVPTALAIEISQNGVDRLWKIFTGKERTKKKRTRHGRDEGSDSESIDSSESTDSNDSKDEKPHRKLKPLHRNGGIMGGSQEEAGPEYPEDESDDSVSNKHSGVKEQLKKGGIQEYFERTESLPDLTPP